MIIMLSNSRGQMEQCRLLSLGQYFGISSVIGCNFSSFASVAVVITIIIGVDIQMLFFK